VSLDEPDLSRLAELIARKLAEQLKADEHCLLNRQALADRLRVSERCVTALARRGELPSGYLIGGVRRWVWAEVLRYLTIRGTRFRRRGRGIYNRQPSDLDFQDTKGPPHTTED
jgi:hypothetical protein